MQARLLFVAGGRSRGDAEVREVVRVVCREIGACLERAAPGIGGEVAAAQGDVYAVVPDGAGGWYIGGSFTQINQTPRNRVAHINSDHTLDLNWNPDADSTVYALALSHDGQTLYVGGDFTSIGGQTRNRIAALDAAMSLKGG